MGRRSRPPRLEPPRHLCERRTAKLSSSRTHRQVHRGSKPSLTAERDHAVSSVKAPTRLPKCGHMPLTPRNYVAPPKVFAILTRLSPIPTYAQWFDPSQ